MSDAADSKERDEKRAELRARAQHGTADDDERAEAERFAASELRSITPDEIQMLAATGC